MNTIEDLARQVLATIDELNPHLRYTPAGSALRLYLAEQAEGRDIHEFTIKAARDNYADDDCEIPDEPLLSFAEDAVWVQAWVRVPLEKEPYE